MNKLSFAYLPIGTSFILVPILMMIGGRDLGAYGTNNEVTDVFVKMLWFLIPSGVIISLLCTPSLFILGKTREALLVLLLSFPVFPAYLVLCSMIIDFLSQMYFCF